MKKVLVLGSLVLAVACQPAGEAGNPASVTLESEEQQTAYALGFKLGENVRGLELSEAEMDAFHQGLGDAAGGTAAQVDMKQAEARVQQLATRSAARAAESRQESEAAFLAQAAEQEGAVQTESGLIIVHTSEGEGATPAATDKVKVHYHGTFTDGKVFDSSVERGEPAVFPLNRVIPCWTEGVQRIKVGGKATLTCPSKIAYGPTGAPPRIPPGATLVFEVELIEIVE